jgi:Cof subfamily protein (haloacid dehalogenase superfamily)
MTSMQTYRMLALDVDGTIATKNHNVPEAILAAIGDAISAGVIVSIVTGRMRRSALRFAELCGTNGPTISYQGAVTTASDGVKDIHTERLVPSLATSSLETMRGASAHINLYADDEVYVEHETSWALDYATRMETELQVVESLDDFATNGPTVIMAVDEPPRIAQIAAQLRASLGPEAAVTQSLPYFCEVASSRATKGASLARVCVDYGIEAGEVIAIGDGEGDVSMIEWAGIGVAAGEAHSAARAAAQMRIAGPGENGVAEFVQNLLRQGKLGR